MLPLLFLTLACIDTGADIVPHTDTDTDTAVNVDTDLPPLTIDTGNSTGLTGTIPEVALEAPTFTATNLDNTSRNRDDLLGHPTVVWFYPLANTPG
jgi:hypothetical protein